MSFYLWHCSFPDLLMCFLLTHKTLNTVYSTWHAEEIIPAAGPEPISRKIFRRRFSGLPDPTHQLLMCWIRSTMKWRSADSSAPLLTLAFKMRSGKSDNSVQLWSSLCIYILHRCPVAVPCSCVDQVDCSFQSYPSFPHMHWSGHWGPLELPFRDPHLLCAGRIGTLSFLFSSHAVFCWSSLLQYGIQLGSSYSFLAP